MKFELVIYQHLHELYILSLNVELILSAWILEHGFIIFFLFHRWVDEVIPDAPWVISQEFIDKHNIEFVAHDSLP